MVTGKMEKDIKTILHGTAKETTEDKDSNKTNLEGLALALKDDSLKPLESSRKDEGNIVGTDYIR